MGTIREVLELLKTINAKLDWLVEAAQSDMSADKRAQAFVDASARIQSQVTGR